MTHLLGLAPSDFRMVFPDRHTYACLSRDGFKIFQLITNDLIKLLMLNLVNLPIVPIHSVIWSKLASVFAMNSEWILFVVEFEFLRLNRTPFPNII